MATYRMVCPAELGERGYPKDHITITAYLEHVSKSRCGFGHAALNKSCSQCDPQKPCDGCVSIRTESMAKVLASMTSEERDALAKAQYAQIAAQVEATSAAMAAQARQWELAAKNSAAKALGLTAKVQTA